MKNNKPDHKDAPIPGDVTEDINKQTGVVDWTELEKHFARGVVIRVDNGLDLVEVAHSMSVDNTSQMETWLASGSVGRASDDNAREWSQDNPEFWCVVVAPWILVQKKGLPTEIH